MRINQFVARSSGLSRRAADAAITEGRVTIAGSPASLGGQAQAGDDIRLDGTALTLPETSTYIALNKPVAYISSRRRQGTDPTVYDLLPETYHRLRLAGRLDRDSSGLVLFSDDGDFIYDVTHPSQSKTKEYELTLTRSLSEKDRTKLQSGVTLEDGPSVITITRMSGHNATAVLEEGRNRQVRRTLGALGYTITKLHRTRIGPYELSDLKPGAWVKITRMTSS